MLRHPVRLVLLLILTLSLVGCPCISGKSSTATTTGVTNTTTTVTTTTTTVTSGATGIDGVACIGEIKPDIENIKPITNDELLIKALASSENGKLCQGKVYEVTKPIKVYRVWDSKKDYTLRGSWWSFVKPAGPKDKYRKENAICPGWSPLDKLSNCTIKPGSHIVIGTGQSAKCKTQTYPKSAELQVYIANDGRKKKYLVENCTAGTDWP